MYSFFQEQATTMDFQPPFPSFQALTCPVLSRKSQMEVNTKLVTKYSASIGGEERSSQGMETLTMTLPVEWQSTSTFPCTS